MRHSRSALPTIVLFLVLATAHSTAATDDPSTPGTLSALAEDGSVLELPLRHTSVSIEISSFVARTTVEQLFVNPFDHPIEAIYTFPLGHDAAVDEFEMQSGEHVVRGEIHRRAEAREIYEAARSEGRQAALLEQERPNIFTQSVANLLPAGEVRIRLRTVEVLDYEAGVYQMTFPLVVGPRYVPGETLATTVSSSTASTSPPPSPVNLPRGYRSGHDVEIQVTLDAGVPLHDLASPSHAIEVDRDQATRARVRLSPDDRIPNKDFILRWTVGSSRPDTGVLTHRDGTDGYFAFVIQPQGSIDIEQAAPKEILFVLDTSGSMGGAPLRISRAFIREALKTLGSRDTFNLIRFAGGASVFSDVALDGTKENVRKARRWIERLKASGGTEMLRGLERAVQLDDDAERYRLVVFLTDGYIGNEDQILDHVRKLPDEVRVFTVGIGGSVNHSLLDGMARVGGGAYTFIPNDRDASIALKRFTSWITRPYLTDLEIDWGALPVGDWIPEIPRDLFSGQNLTVVGRYFGAAEGSILIRGRLGGRYWETEFPIVLPEVETRHGALGSIWARQRIQALLDESPGAASPQAREEVVELSLEHQLMSPFTSFAAVDYRVVNPGGDSETIVQPVPLPKGVFERTASNGITVRVVDDEGEPLPGATVTLSSETGRVKTTAVLSDRNGTADFPVLASGAGYVVHVSFPGFAPVRYEGIRVETGNGVLLPVMLTSEVVERVRVTARRQVVDLESTASSSLLSEDFIADLAVPGRFYSNVLTMTAGVNDANGDGIPNVHGARSRDFVAMVGGVRNVAPLTGQFVSQVNMNSIEEIEVVASGAGVEFGRAQGGFARVIQKQGNNEHEGLFDLKVGSSVLDGIGARSIPVSYAGLQGGFHLSGPFLRDRLWYRASHEWLDRTDPVVAGSQIFVVPQTVVSHSDMLTWQVSPRNKLKFLAQWERDDASGLGVSSFVRPETTPSIDRDERLFSVGWTAPYSPKILIESTLSRRDTGFERSPVGTPAANGCLPAEDPFLGSAECLDLVAGAQTGTVFRGIDDKRRRYGLESTATIYGGRVWGATHQFKLGLEIGFERYARQIAREPDLVRTPGDGVGTILARTNALAISESVADSRNWALFVEDQLKPRQNLTLTVGLRLDSERIEADGFAPFDPRAELERFVVEAEGLTEKERIVFAGEAFTGPEDLQGFLDGVAQRIGGDRCCADPLIGPERIQSPRRPARVRLDALNLSPFFSAKWSPWSDGRTAFSFSLRRYFDKLLPVYALVETEPATADLFLTSEAALVRPSIQRVDPALRTPYQDEWVFGFEREIMIETRLSVSLVFRNFESQIQQLELNHQPGGADGRGELYVQNPLWGDIFLVGNYGNGSYRGFTLALERRQYRSWEMRASYTYSEARGSAEAWNPMFLDQRTLLENVDGFQSFDQRHVMKLHATFITAWGYRLGGSLVVESGLPYSTLEHRVVYDAIPQALKGLTQSVPVPRLTYTTATRNATRNAPFVDLNLRVTKEIHAGRGVNLRVHIDLFNALNDRSYRIYPGERAYGRSINGFEDSTSRFGRRYAIGLEIAY